MITGKALDIAKYLLSDACDKNVEYDLVLHKAKRTLSQNAYYWQLVEKLVVVTHEPKAKLHNLYLRELGLLQRIDDKPIYILLPDTEKAENEALNAVSYHLTPSNKTKLGDDGKMYRWYAMLRGSKELNVHEMSALLDLAIQDAKAQGIEVLTPAELEHMKQLEQNRENKKNDTVRN